MLLICASVSASMSVSGMHLCIDLTCPTVDLHSYRPLQISLGRLRLASGSWPQWDEDNLIADLLPGVLHLKLVV